MTPAGQSYRAEIEVTCRSLEEHLAMLHEKCVTADQKMRLRNTYSAARYALWKVDGREPAVGGDLPESTHNDLKVTNTRMRAMLKNVDDIDAFLNLAAEAVRLAEVPVADLYDGIVYRRSIAALINSRLSLGERPD
jgi:hypothetical protein